METAEFPRKAGASLAGGGGAGRPMADAAPRDAERIFASIQSQTLDRLDRQKKMLSRIKDVKRERDFFYAKLASVVALATSGSANGPEAELSARLVDIITRKPKDF